LVLFAFWATPTITSAHGEHFRLYRSRVPMLFPRLTGRMRGRVTV
jgi:hypothetical protein